jgi:hypothetical protein
VHLTPHGYDFSLVVFETALIYRHAMPKTKWLLSLALLVFVGALRLDAQIGAGSSRNAQAINNSRLTVLSGTVHPLARPQYDRGVAPASLPIGHMLLVLKRSPQQQAALDSLLAEQQDPNSPSYHKWLTPAQFGAEFGASDQDIQTITSWLKSQGFTVNSVSNGRTVIDFSGTAAIVQSAFHTAIHRYVLPDGTQHWANSANIEIPAALTSMVAGVRSLNNFFPKPQYHSAVRPAFTYNYGAPCSSATDNNCYDLTPTDFDTIYNVPATATGSGETIAIVSDSDVVASDLTTFRSLFGVPAMTLSNSGNPSTSAPSCASGPCFVQLVTPYGDPGVQCPLLSSGQVPSYAPASCTTSSNGDESEAILDAEWAGSTAPAASIWLVNSADTPTTFGSFTTSFGGDLSANYIVNCPTTGANCPVAVPAHVLSDSYATCEATLGSTGNTFYGNLWSQAASEGITVVVASGDSGSAGCDFYSGTLPEPSEQGLAVNGVASTPYDVAVGGTDFNQSSNPSQFWSATNSGLGASALGYIPETTWNDSCTNATFGSSALTDCNNPNLDGSGTNNENFIFTLGGGGGPSSTYSKPCWQLATLTAPCAQPGAATPSDSARDIPDISFFASDGFSGSAYIVCEADSTDNPVAGQAGMACSLSTPPASSVTQSSFEEVGGTSVAAQAFAGIAALIDQQGGGIGQGNIDDHLYNIAGGSGNTCTSAASPASNCVFYDVTSGTISQPCDAITNPPGCTGTGALNIGLLESGGQLAYNAGTGYDYATGLGSINISNLFCKAAALTCTTTSLQAAPTTITSGQSSTLTATVAPQAGSGTPTGTVNFLEGGTTLNSSPVTLVAGVATFPAASLVVGTHSITAAYSGDSNFAPSTSSAVQVQVNPAPSPDFTVSATPPSQTVTAGQSTNYTLTLTPQNGFSSAVTISCTGAPAQSTCAAASSPVTLNGTSASQVQVNVTTTAASLLPPVSHPFSGWRAPAVFASLLLLCLLVADRFNRHSIAVRRWLAGAACTVAIGFVLAGCGGGNKTPTNSGTPKGTYTLTITGTSGSTTHAATVSLVVQ